MSIGDVIDIFAIVKILNCKISFISLFTEEIVKMKDF